jgi:hypothetical protein
MFRTETAVLWQARRSFPFIERIYADGGCQGPKMAKAVAWRLHIVKRSDLHRFVVLLNRWIVERDLRLDQPLPSTRQGLRTSRSQSRCLHPPRHDPHHAQADHRKPFRVNPNLSALWRQSMISTCT